MGRLGVGLPPHAPELQPPHVWKTDKGWKGKCATFTLTLTDGTQHTAKFQFK